MKVMFLLIGISLLVAAGFLIAFIRSVSHGQYDDTHTPSVRILFDDGPVQERPSIREKKKTQSEV